MFNASKVKAAWIDDKLIGYARNNRELDAIYAAHDFADLAVFSVAIGEDDSHNMILARCKLDAARRSGDEAAVLEAEVELELAEAAAGPSIPFLSI